MSFTGWNKEKANRQWRAKTRGKRQDKRRRSKSETKLLTPEEKERARQTWDWLLSFRQRERDERKRLAGEYPDSWTKAFRDKLKSRDKNTCFLCRHTNKPSRLHLHHINYYKYDCDSYNLITLCGSCHPKTNHQRKKWLELFHRNTRIIRLIELHAPLIIIRNEHRILVRLFKGLGLCPPKDDRVKEVKHKYIQLFGPPTRPLKRDKMSKPAHI